MKHPVIAGYGAVQLKPDAAFQPDLSLNYKVLFDIRETSNTAEEINQGLDHVAKLLNLLVPKGIKPSDIDIVAVLHGPAIVAILNDENFQKKFDRNNPNSELIAELCNHGVRIYACEQALAKQGLPSASVHEKVDLALSSLLVMIICQLQNFAYVPFN
jgi:intracellular sulfur oxidation DsrE/DsrF family protein